MRNPTVLVGLVALAALLTPPAAAQAPGAAPTPVERGSVITAFPGEGPFANRGGSLPPVVATLQADGVKFVSLGEEGGIRSYLGEAANGRFQAFYVAPDGEHVVAGLMFEPGGANVTGRQVAAMLRRFNAAASATPGLDASSLQPVPDEDAAPAKPDVTFADWLRASGAKLTPFLERDGGLDGYFVESRAEEGNPSKMQPFYVFPDGRHAVAGILIRRGGMFVTALQIHALQQRFTADEAAARQPRNSQVQPGSPNPPAAPEMLASSKDAAVPAAPVAGATVPDLVGALAAATAEPAVERPLATADAGSAPARPAAPVVAATPVQPVMPAGPISAKPVGSAAPYQVKVPDQAEFLRSAKDSVWFSVGMKGVPAVWMVADPQCPFCHETWRRLKPLVFDGKLQVRVILIAGLKGSDPFVRSILSRGTPVGTDASMAWLQGEGSINNVNIQAPPADGTPANEAAKRFVSYNTAFAQKYEISRTPFLFYTVPDGGFYASVGVPDDLDAFLSALR